MGQKVCPIGLRLGITEEWRSRWYANKKDFGRFLVEDNSIRKFVKKNYGFAGIPKIEVERTREAVTIVVHTASPGVLIGRRGSKVDKLTEDLESLVGRRVDLKIIEVETPELCAQLVGESIAEQLEKRSPYRRAMRKAAEAAMNQGALGVKVRIAGRIGGAEIARDEGVLFGSVPLSTLRAEIDYGAATAILSKGTIGIKVWIFKGERLPDKEKKHAVDAQADKVPQVAPGKAEGGSPTG
ncbi:MAG: 30S ribosomal protein S3 [Planctomycetes bacterium]|nr:30S ribosomal protein S3 [Planctomycetota bacterium]